MRYVAADQFLTVTEGVETKAASASPTASHRSPSGLDVEGGGVGPALTQVGVHVTTVSGTLEIDP